MHEAQEGGAGDEAGARDALAGGGFERATADEQEVKGPPRRGEAVSRFDHHCMALHDSETRQQSHDRQPGRQAQLPAKGGAVLPGPEALSVGAAR